MPTEPPGGYGSYWNLFGVDFYNGRVFWYNVTQSLSVDDVLTSLIFVMVLVGAILLFALRTRPKIGGAAIAPPPSTSVASSFTEPFGCSFALVGYCNTWYFYAASNDGSSSITQSLFSFAQDYNVTNGLGYQSVILGYSQTSNLSSIINHLSIK